MRSLGAYETIRCVKFNKKLNTDLRAFMTVIAYSMAQKDAIKRKTKTKT